MRRRRDVVRALAAAVVAACLAPPSAAAAPQPFGHACTAQNGVRFCPTVELSERVPSFDGSPIDVDVTLPPEGEGPWPTIVMMHGYGGSKTDFETERPEGKSQASATLHHWNNVWFAQRGYAVVNHSARGFGRSCGTRDSRTPDCARGYVHLADQRYEARDVQHLLGLLVDQRIARPDALGVTGISYGGGQSMELALLNDRVRNPDGSFSPWTSPGGTPLKIAAAWPRWLWSDLVYSLLPNGRFLDFTVPTETHSREPLGVPIASYITGLYAVGNANGFYAPPGTDPDADLTSWYTRVMLGEPETADARAIADEIFNHHQGFGLGTKAPPLLLQDGWTDDLFPVHEALRIYNLLRAADPDADVSLQFADIGHARGQNKPNADVFFNDQGSAFFDKHLKGVSSPEAPAPGSVTTFTQTCPREAPAGGPFRAASWPEIHPGAVRLEQPAAQTISSLAGDPDVARQIDPIAGGGACVRVAARDEGGTAVYRLPASSGWTLMGRPTVRARIATSGIGGQLASRLWDVAPDGRQTLVTRGIYRLEDNQRGEVVFQLWGNGYRFEPGHVAKLELLGRDAPYARPSNFPFTVEVSDLRLELPVAERPDGGQVLAPSLATLRTSARPRRVRPRLAVRVTPRRDRRGARVFTVRGRVEAGLAVGRRACTGRISAQWKTGRRTISNRRAALRRDCSFRVRVRFRAPSRFAGRSRLKLTVRFAGNRLLAPARSRPRYVRVR